LALRKVAPERLALRRFCPPDERHVPWSDSSVLPLSSIGNLRESKTRNPIRSLSHDNYLTPDLWKCADSKVKTNVQHRPKIKAQVPLTPKYAIKGKAIAPVRIIILNSIGAAQNI